MLKRQMCSTHRDWLWLPQYEGLLRWHQGCLYTLGLLISGQIWLLGFFLFIFTHKAHFDILNILLWILNEIAHRILCFGCGALVVQPLSLSPAAQAVLPSKQPCAQLSLGPGGVRNVKSIWRTS